MSVSHSFPRISSAAVDGRARNIRYRQTQFHRLQAQLLGQSNAIKEAILADCGTTPQDANLEFCYALLELRKHYETLDMKKDLEEEYRIEKRQDNLERRIGVNIVYIVPTSYTLFYSVLAPLTAAMASGNCVILELPQKLHQVGAILRTMLPKALDADTFAISESRPPASALEECVVVLQQPDGLQQEQRQNNTYSPTSPPQLMSLSDRQSLAVVDRSADIDQAARSLVASRFSFGGKSPYAPKVVLVNEYVAEQFIADVIQHVAKSMTSRQPRIPKSERKPSKTEKSFSKIAEAESTTIAYSGPFLTVLDVTDRSSPLLRQEISGNFLAVHRISSLDDAIDWVNSSHGTLAAVYPFAALQSATYLSNFIDAHLSCVNHVPAELLVGPVAPGNHPISLNTRYMPHMFQVPRAQIATQSSMTKLLQKGTPTRLLQHLSNLTKSVESPLPPTQQREGKAVGFFEQGLLTGAAVLATPILTAFGALAYVGLSRYRCS